MKKTLCCIALTLAFCNSIMADKIDEQARKIAHRYPLIDGHIDVPYRLKEKWDDVTQATITGDFDYQRAKAGGLSAPFMSIYTPSNTEAKGATALADVLIDQVEAIVYRAPDRFAIARSSTDIQKHFKAGRIALLLGMENGAPIAGDLNKLKHFYDRGVRYITLTHALSNHIADSSYDKIRLWQGLSPFGVKLIAEMNRLGVMIDIAHVSDEAFYQVLKVSKVPVIASHSSLRHFTPGLERNVDDAMLKALARNGGVIMINFGSYFIAESARQHSDQKRVAEEGFKKLHGDSPTSEASKQFEQEYLQRHPYPFAKIGDVADHIDYAVKLVGIDYVGLGSDFDGVGDTLPIGLKDVSQYPNLIAELLRRGYTESDIAKIMSGNALRVMEAVEKYAARSK